MEKASKELLKSSCSSALAGVNYAFSKNTFVHTKLLVSAKHLHFANHLYIVISPEAAAFAVDHQFSFLMR